MHRGALLRGVGDRFDQSASRVGVQVVAAVVVRQPRLQGVGWLIDWWRGLREEARHPARNPAPYRRRAALVPWWGHLCVGESDGLTLGGHENDFLVDLNALLETEKTGQNELITVVDSVNRAVLDDNALVASQKTLKGRDDSAEVRLVAVVV